MANKRRLGLFFLPGWILAGLLLAPQPGLAHPLGNFSVNHYAAVRVERDVVELHYVLDMAEIPAFQVIQETGMVPEVGHISVREYLARQTEVLQDGLRLEANGSVSHLRASRAKCSFPRGRRSADAQARSAVSRAARHRYCRCPAPSTLPRWQFPRPRWLARDHRCRRPRDHPGA